MSIVNIRNIELVHNPAQFDAEYHFRIKFEAIAPLAEDLEWRLIYVGSAESEDYDQELDSCMVGPVPVGVNAFDFTAPAPKHELLPSRDSDEILGVTVIIITASYRDKEFVRVGYYVNTYYEDEELKESPPAEVQWDKLHRNVLIAKPKVTRFHNPWDAAAPTSSAFDTPIYDSQSQQQQQQYQQQQQQQQQQYQQQEQQQYSGSNEIHGGNNGNGMDFYSAPVPAPIQKAPAVPTSSGIGMEVD